jgi:hypothetical protein
MTPKLRLGAIAMLLRQADVNEVVAATGKSPAEAIAASIDAALSSYVMIHEGKVEGVFGITDGEGWVIPWMLATDNLHAFRRQFLPESRRIVSDWSDEHYVLYNHVDSRHTEALHWLRWLGFHIHTDCPLTLHDPSVSFYPFTMYRSNA